MKAIIFDMDGVIFDTEPLWRNSLLILNKKYNTKITEEERLCACGMNLTEQYKYFERFMPEGLSIKIFNDEWNAMVLDQLRNTNISIIKNGFKELHTYLKEKGIKIGLNSGSPRASIEFYFSRENFNVNDLFDFTISGDEIKLGKPDPEGYTKVCKALNENPADCIVIEDSINGIISAHKAGCQTIMVLDAIKPNEETKNMCKFIANSLNDVLNYLENNEKI